MKKLANLSLITIMLVSISIPSYAGREDEELADGGNALVQKIADKGDFLQNDSLYRIIDKKTGNIIYVMTSSVPGVADQIEVVPAGLTQR